jgi:hypothetical protein
VIRSPREQAARLEFLVGGFGAWLVITFVTIHHDIRYGMPLLGFLAVMGAGWIACVPRKAQLLGIAILAIGVIGNTLADDFGVGSEVKAALVHRLPGTEQVPNAVVFYSPNGFLAAAPARDGDVPGLLEELHREGVRAVVWGNNQSEGKDFSSAGLLPLAEIAKLTPELTRAPEFSSSPSVVTLVHEPVSARAPATCARLSDGTGVWVVRFDTAARKLALYCPRRRPRFYAVGAVR